MYTHQKIYLQVPETSVAAAGTVFQILAPTKIKVRGVIAKLSANAAAATDIDITYAAEIDGAADGNLFEDIFDGTPTANTLVEKLGNEVVDKGEVLQVRVNTAQANATVVLTLECDPAWEK